MKVISFLEHNNYTISEEDMICLLKEIDLNKYTLLSTACCEWVKPIHDDQIFCDVEWNFCQYWFSHKGFTENDYRYIEAIGYERDQFRKEAI